MEKRRRDESVREDFDKRLAAIRAKERAALQSRYETLLSKRPADATTRTLDDVMWIVFSNRAAKNSHQHAAQVLNVPETFVGAIRTAP